MASNFQAHVTAVLKDTSSVTAQLQRLGKTPIKLANVTIDTQKIVNQLKSALSMAGMNLNNTGLNAAAKKTGQQVGKNLGQGVLVGRNNINKSSKQLLKDFVSDYQNVSKKINTKEFDASIAKIGADYKKVLSSGHEDVKNGSIVSNIKKMHGLKQEMTTLYSQGEMGVQQLIGKFHEFNTLQDTTRNQLKKVNSDIAQFGTQKTPSKKLSLADYVKPTTVSQSEIQKQAKRDFDDYQKALKGVQTGKFTAKVANQRAQLQKLLNYDHPDVQSGKIGAQITEMDNLTRSMAAYSSQGEAGANNLVKAFRKFNDVQASAHNNLKTVNSDMALFANQKAVANTQKQLATFMNSGTVASKKYGGEVRNLSSQLDYLANRGKVPAPALEKIDTNFAKINANAAKSGGLMKTFGRSLQGSLGSLSRYIGVTGVLMYGMSGIKSGVNNVIELDDALVDLKKTSNASAGELKNFYFSSNDTAKSLGVTTKEVIQGAADWSRLGYSIKDAQKMSEVTAKFKTISPGMTFQQSTDGLVSSMKAFHIEADDALEGVASKINIIGNTQAVSNQDIVEILTRSSSAMSEANNSLEETIALGTAATEITRNPAKVGNALKTVSMRLRGYDETTGKSTKNTKELNGEIANLTKTAKNPNGVSLFKDKEKTQFKSTAEILRDISKIYGDLTDKQQASLLEKIGGKHQGQVVAAILNNFDAVEKSLDTMKNSAGSADREMGIVSESLKFKLNALKETGVGIAQNLFQTNQFGTFIDGLTKVLGVIDKVTEKLGLFGTVGTTAGIIGAGKAIKYFVNSAKEAQEVGIAIKEIEELLRAYEAINGIDTTQKMTDVSATEALTGAMGEQIPIAEADAGALSEVAGAAGAEASAQGEAAGATAANTGAMEAQAGVSGVEGAAGAAGATGVGKAAGEADDVAKIGANKVDDAVLAGSAGMSTFGNNSRTAVKGAEELTEDFIKMEGAASGAGVAVTEASEGITALRGGLGAAGTGVFAAGGESIAGIATAAGGLSAAVPPVLAIVGGIAGLAIVSKLCATDFDKMQKKAGKASDEYTEASNNLATAKKNLAGTRAEIKRIEQKEKKTGKKDKSGRKETLIQEEQEQKHEVRIREGEKRYKQEKKYKTARDALTKPQTSMPNGKGSIIGDSLVNTYTEGKRNLEELKKQRDRAFEEVDKWLRKGGDDESSKYHDKYLRADKKYNDYSKQFKDEEKKQTNLKDKMDQNVSALYNSDGTIPQKNIGAVTQYNNALKNSADATENFADKKEKLQGVFKKDDYKKGIKDFSDYIKNTGDANASIENLRDSLGKTGFKKFQTELAESGISVGEAVYSLTNYGNKLKNFKLPDAQGNITQYKNLGDTAKGAYDNLSKMGGFKGLSKEEKFDTKTITEQGQVLRGAQLTPATEQDYQEVIDKMNNLKASPTITVEGVANANAVIAQCQDGINKLNQPAIMSINTDGMEPAKKTLVEDLQAFQKLQDEKQIELAVGADTSEVDKKMEDLRVKITGDAADIGFNMDTSSVDSVLGAMQGKSFVADIQASTSTDNLMPNLNLDGTLTYKPVFEEETPPELLGLAIYQALFQGGKKAPDKNGLAKYLQKIQGGKKAPNKSGNAKYRYSIKDGKKAHNKSGNAKYGYSVKDGKKAHNKSGNAKYGYSVKDGKKAPNKSGNASYGYSVKDGKKAPDKSGHASYSVSFAVSITKTITTHLKRIVENVKGSSKPKGAVNGTAHARGSAYAGGNWGIGAEQTALVGELGQEIVVDPRDSSWYTVGDRGAEFVNLPRNAIVFNHLQTKSLLSNGYAIGRGKAHATGTFSDIDLDDLDEGIEFYASGSAYANGKKYKTYKTKGKTALEKFQNWFGKLFDWIEVKLERMIDKIDKYTAKADYQKDRGDYKNATANYKSATKETISELITQSKAEKKYSKQGTKVLNAAYNTRQITTKTKKKKNKKGKYTIVVKKTKIKGKRLINKKQMAAIKKQVASGNLNIKKYGAGMQEVIKDYKEFYDKAQAANKAMIELNKTIQEQITQLKELRNAQRDAKVERSSSLAGIATGGLNKGSDFRASQLSLQNTQLISKQNAYSSAVSSLTGDLMPGGKYITKKNKKGKKTKVYKRNNTIGSLALDAAYGQKKSKKASGKKKSHKNYKDALNTAIKQIKARTPVKSSTLNVIKKNDPNTYYKCLEYNYALQKLEESRLENAVAQAEASSEIYQNILDSTSSKNERQNNLIDLYKKQAEVSNGSDAKNQILDTAAKSYDKIVSNDTALVNSLNKKRASWGKKITSSITTKKDKKGKKTTIYKGETAALKKQSKGTRTKVRNAMKKARDCVNGKKMIPAGTINALANYYAKGWITLGFFKACIEYNNSLDAWNQAKEQKIIDQATAKLEKAAIGQQQFENKQKTYENTQNTIDASTSLVKAKQDVKETRGVSLTQSDYNNLISQGVKLINSYTEEINALNKVIDENIKKKYWTTSTQEYKDAKNSVTELEGRIQEVIKEQEEYNNAIAEIPYNNLETAVNKFDAIKGYYEAIISLHEQIGTDSTIEDYNNKLDAQNDKLQKLIEKSVQAKSDWEAAMVSTDNVYGGKKSDEWEQTYYEYLTDIEALKSDIDNLKDTMRDDVFWRDLDRAHDVAARVKEELDGIYDLIDEDMRFDKDGNLTEYGVTSIALLVKTFETSREQVQNFTNDIENLNNLFAQGEYTELQYQEKLAELKKSLLESASDMKTAMSNIREMYKSIDKNELETISNLIDKRKEALKAKKEYYDYDKTIKEKTKDIQELTNQIAALEGIDTAEARAEAAKLKEELSDVKEELEDTQKEHYFDISSEAFDRMSDVLQEEFDEKWDNLELTLDDMQTLISDAKALYSANSSQIATSLDKLLAYFGISSSATGIGIHHASGTRSVSSSHIGLSNETGTELIVTKNGIISKFNPRDGVVPPALTKRLYDMATGKTLTNNGLGAIAITQHYDALINIEGSADAATVSDLQRISQDILEKSYNYTTNRIKQDYIKTGGSRRIS